MVLVGYDFQDYFFFILKKEKTIFFAFSLAVNKSSKQNMTHFIFTMSRATTRPQGSDYFHSVLSTCSTFCPSQEDFCFLKEANVLSEQESRQNTHLTILNRTVRTLGH